MLYIITGIVLIVSALVGFILGLQIFGLLIIPLTIPILLVGISFIMIEGDFLLHERVAELEREVKQLQVKQKMTTPEKYEANERYGLNKTQCPNCNNKSEVNTCRFVNRKSVRSIRPITI